ncbi:MAG: carboxypeptidase regulatory-like domain-containing protein [Candidatus Kapabacteria bacterium]|nr:carboxypeptidase regulatory-like domain-containing protein [Ignavibacteriota bacterium]MCW5886145.1 carboxypeptidase regulatory-like domain-containing protein [Candidatus Kapabacteria bacterium]
MKLYFFLILSALMLIFVQSCTDNTTSPDKSFTFSGFVYDADDNPIVEASVEIIDESEKVKYNTKTNAEGEFSFSAVNIDFETYRLRISADGFKTMIKSPNDFLKDGKSENLNIKLSKLSEDDDCCGVISFVVKKNDSDDLLSGAEVKLSNKDGIIDTKKTSDDGKVEFTELCEGKFFYRIALDGFKVLEGYKEIGKCDTVEVAVELIKKQEEEETCCNNSADFLIKDESGNPLKSVKVLFRRDGAVKYEGYSDESGKLKITDICKGKYSVLIKQEGFASQELDLEFDCEQNLEKAVVLKKNSEEPCCDNILKVSIKEAGSGNPINDAKLILWQNGKMIYYGYSKDGIAAIDGICKGKYTAEIVIDGYKSIEWSIEFDCKQTIEIIKELQKKEGSDCCGKAFIYIKDNKSGNPIANAEVKVTFDGKNRILKTDENGKVVFEELCIGKHFIRVAHSDYKVSEDYFYIESCDKPVEKDIKLQGKEGDDCCNNQMKFEINDKDGNLLNNVQIKIIKEKSIVTTLKTQNGTAASDKQLCKGNYVVMIYHESYDVLEFEVYLDCNEVKEFNKILTKKDVCCDAWAKVWVTDFDTKKALNGSKVRIWKDGKLIETLTVEDGYVKFTNLCEGKYAFDVTYDGYKGQEWNSEIKCKQDNVFEKQMKKVE